MRRTSNAHAKGHSLRSSKSHVEELLMLIPKGKNMDKSKWISFFRLIAGALIIELIVCNFSAWKSLFYQNITVFEHIEIKGGTEINEKINQYLVPDGILTLHINDVDMTIHNLFFALDFSENTPISYTVSLTDAGNYYPYNLPEQILMPGIPKSFYTNVYPSGEVNTIIIQLTVPEGSTVIVNGIYANAHIPFLISLGRFLCILGIISLFYYLLHTDKWPKKICGTIKKQRLITTAVIVFLMGSAWFLAHINPICINPPWPHHKQYQELAEVMAEGRLYLDKEPSEDFLNVKNPYDTIYLKAEEIDYPADYVYYEGRYYVYFGIVPELLLYCPVHLLTGHHMPNYMAVFLFYCGFILAVFALYREIIKQWFNHTPYFLYLMLCILTVCCGNYLFVIARPDLYDIPIMAATMFTVAGLYFWIRGKYTKTTQSRKVHLFIGSLCMALVAGCRPQMLLFSILAVPLFWDEFILKHRVSGRASEDLSQPGYTNSSHINIDKNTISDAVGLCLPYLFVAMGIMYYNAVRFGSPFDFGAAYSLTSNDMTKRSFNMHQTLLGLWHYIFRPPVIESDFPFLQGIQISSSSYMGKLNGEYTYGGILICNAFLWILFTIRSSRKILKDKGIYTLTIASVIVTIILSVVDVTGAGILQRYMVDMIWGVWFAARLLMLAWIEKSSDRRTWKAVALFLAVVCLLQSAYGFGIVFGNGDIGMNVRLSNPELYYYLQELVKF